MDTRIKHSVVKSTSLYSSVSVFTLSIIACLVLLLLERLVGIEWDYHPDANTYIELSQQVASNVDLIGIPNNFYYLLVNFLGSNIWVMISLNIVLYSITNVRLMRFFQGAKNLHKGATLLFFLVVFNPYRTHLSIHVLKDTLVIFTLVFFATNKRPASLWYFFLLYLTSVRSLIYLVAFFNKRNIFILIVPIVLFFSVNPDFLFSILTGEQVDMRFRSYDLVPNFYEYGGLAPFVRFVVWPFIFLTGFFIFLSPNFLFFPVALGPFLLQYWHLRQYGNITFYLPVYIAMGLLAFMVSGFTSYVRYALPLLTILPILIIKKGL